MCPLRHLCVNLILSRARLSDVGKYTLCIVEFCFEDLSKGFDSVSNFLLDNKHAGRIMKTVTKSVSQQPTGNKESGSEDATGGATII